jgi:hypothetical protein
MSCSAAVATCPLAAIRPRAMRKCECTGTTFEDVSRRLDRGEKYEAICEQTGCGRMCSACVPDLEEYLMSLQVAIAS